MQSEELDKKIREAADHHHPAYDEQAWMKMEKLLNKHLPEKKDDRKRFIFFILLFLLIGGGITGLFILRDRNAKTQITELAAGREPLATSQEKKATSREPLAASQEKKGTGREPQETSQEPGPGSQEKKATSQEPEANSQEKQATSTKPGVNNRGSLVLGSGKATAKTKQHINSTPQPVISRNASGQNGEPRTVNPVQQTTGTEPVANNSGSVVQNADQPGSNAQQQPTSIQQPAPAIAGSAATAVITEINAQEKNKDVITKTNKDRSRNTKRSSSFSLNFSAGPDVSIVGTGKTGKVNLTTGIGIGYTYKDRLTIRTGFFAANKVYTAEPGDYHPPYQFYYYYPNLQKIEANCRVYEIPVSLSYHFGNNKKQNWFVSSGISSYLMKRETYNYFYKQTPTQPTISKKRTMNGVNKHYFSVLTVSGGFQKNISRSVSLTVEPYLKVPLNGIGYGKVKLNSSGVMVTVGVRPFDLFRKGK